MAAGLGFKTFTTGEVLSAADVNGYLMQGINVFADATARDAAITSPQEGQFAYTKDNNSLWYYSGSAWVASGATGDIEGVTAGVGISGGGTSGTVTITNSMATAIDAKGDLVAGTGADAFARLAVGTNGQLLTADSTASTGLAWTTVSSGAMTQLATGSMSGVSTVTISSISGSYRDLRLVLTGFKGASNTDLQLRINGLTSAIYGDLSASNNQTYANNYWQLGATVGTGSNNHSNIEFPNYADTTVYKYMNYNALFQSNTNLQTYGQWIAGSTSTAAITSITFFTGSINWNAGTYTLYGVK